MELLSKALLSVSALTLTACALTPPDSSRDEVQSEVRMRLDLELPMDESAAAMRDRVTTTFVDGELSADEAVRLAIANNQQLRAILANLDIAQAELWQAALPPNPVLDAQLRFVESGDGKILELGVAESVIDLLLLPRRKQVADARHEQVQAEVTGAVLDLATEVRTAYRELQAQVELVALYGTAVDATFLSFDAARRLHDAGNINELEVLQEQALFEDAKLALVGAQTMERTGRERLNALLGIWGADGDGWAISPRLPMPAALEVDPADLERRVLEASLDLVAKQHALTALGHKVGLERLEVLFPEGTVGVTAEREAGGEWSVGPMVAFSVPVFDFGGAANASARARVEQAYAEYTDLAVRVRGSARSAYLESESTRNSSRYLLEVVVPLRAQITHATQLQFNAMQIGVFQLLQARRQELDAGRQYVEALRDHWIARTRLESILLGRLPQARFGITSPGTSGEASMSANNNQGGH